MRSPESARSARHSPGGCRQAREAGAAPCPLSLGAAPPLAEAAAEPPAAEICKTRAPKANADAAPDGVVGARQTNPTGFDTFYHVCRADNVCPAGPGETIVSPCGCLDDFPEAVVMMQTVRLGGADMVCTGEVR